MSPTLDNLTHRLSLSLWVRVVLLFPLPFPFLNVTLRVGRFWQHDDTIGLRGGFHGGNVFRCCYRCIGSDDGSRAQE
jgi:hypothetical protein